MKYIQQTLTQVEIDTETGNIRLIKAFTKNLGAGNGNKKKTIVGLGGSLKEEEF
jgi:hypothetical protein